MKLLKQVSERVRSMDNKPYLDFYLCWVYDNKPYAIRVRPHFNCDYDKLCALATEVPKGELIEKYI